MITLPESWRDLSTGAIFSLTMPKISAMRGCTISQISERGNDDGRPPSDAGKNDFLVFLDQGQPAAAGVELDALRGLDRYALDDRNIVRNLNAADRQYSRQKRRAVGNDEHVGRAAAEVDQDRSEFALFLAHDGFYRRKRVEHVFVDRQATPG